MIPTRMYNRTWPAAIALASLIGCSSGGQPTYRAGGRVTFPDGQPLDGGVVEFRSLDLQPSVSARGYIQADGTFQLTTFKPGDGAVEGEHRATVSPPPPLPGSTPDDVLRGKKAASTGPVIDPCYRRFETSGLKFTVTRDPTQNQFSIVVEPPTRRR